MKVQVKLEDQDIKDICKVLRDMLHLDFTDRQLRDFLRHDKHKPMLLDMYQYGVNDASVRNKLLEAVGIRFLSRRCPDPGAACRYYDELRKAAAVVGIKVCDASFQVT